LDKVANEGERKRLQMENDELRVILKQYLNGISVTPDTVQEDNPLVVINSRSGIAIHQPVREGTKKEIYASVSLSLTFG
jgi:dynein regulatory complex subunit 2